ncbi:MAG: hypothetical protein KGL39_54325 [Patescibacteria group bacterium]|nr:hypothetical protein [Patescibacteria group bacterium]
MSSIADTYQFGPASEVAVEAATAENIEVQVVASLAGTAVNPTSLVADYALPSAGVAPSAWSVTTWSTVAKSGSTFYYLLVPVSGLAAGEYDLWVKVADGANVPVHFVGRVQVR